MKFANILFEKDSIVSKDFDDTYFSKNSAIKEKSYVFLEKNNIPQIWQNKEKIIIGENGFGLGLNFLLTCKAFMKDEKRAKELVFYSFDLFPLKFEDLKKIYKNFNELKPFTDELLKHYKNLKNGINIFFFENMNITLILIIDEALSALKSFEKIDIWFIDGFSPSKNSDMYRDNIFEEIKNKSRQGTVFSTYSSAGIIKQGMQKAGFEVIKTKGFGEKKHMLVGEFKG